MKFKIFEKYPELKYGFSEKADGNMKLILTQDLEFNKKAGQNRQNFFEKEGIAGGIYFPKLNHTSAVAVVSGNEVVGKLSEYDALIASEPNIFLAATAADCFLLYFYDPTKKIIGLAHAGWRGTVGGIVKNTIKEMANLGAKKEEILLAIGPGIQKDHFFVKENAISHFAGYGDLIDNQNGRYFVDLPGVVARQAVEAGVKKENIESSGECTFCESKKYFSWRRDKPEILQTMVGYIGVTENGKSASQIDNLCFFD